MTRTPGLRQLTFGAALSAAVLIGASTPASSAPAVVSPTSTILTAPSGTATWAQILANAGVLPPAATPPVTTGGFQAVLGDLGVQPPDTEGSVGFDHVLAFVNGGYRIQTKTGQSLGQVTDRQFWFRIAGIGAISDPRVLFDKDSGRWFATTIANYGSAAPLDLFAVSSTSDPTGLWTFYSIPGGPAGATPDFPQMGFNSKWIAVTHIMFPAGNAEMMVIDKATALAGGTLTSNQFSNPFDAGTPGGNDPVWSPAVTVGSEPNLYMFAASFNSSATSARCRLSKIFGTGPAPKWSVLANSPVLADSGLFDPTAGNGYSFDCVGAPQSGTGILIDAGDARNHDIVFRDGRMWVAHHGGVPFAAPTRTIGLWYELDPGLMDTAVVATSPIVQNGNTGGLDAAGVFHLYPTIAPNASRDACIGFSRTSSALFVEAARSERRVADAANTLRPIVTSQVGLDSFVGSRWGDYSSTRVDPSDDLSFWTIQEYAAVRAGGLRWATWWARFSLQPNPSITCPLAQTLEATGPTGRSVTLSFSVSAPGSTPLTVTLLEGAAILGTATVPAGGPPTSGVAAITATYSIATHVLTAVVADGTGATATCGTTVTIQDTTRPTVTATLSRTLLWTARNALESVGLNSSATDVVNPAPAFVSTTVWSDEGNLVVPFTPDATLVGVGPAATLRLRSERKTNPAGLPAADGRVYLIVVRWTDGTNTGFTCKTVVCPTAMTATKLASANAQAAAAVAFCLGNNGAAPAGYVQLVP